MNANQISQVVDLANAYQEEMRRVLATDAPIEGVVQEGFRPMLQPVEPMYEELYNIGIEKVQNGFYITVGCKKFAFESWETANKYISMYYADPEKTTKAFFDKTLFPKD